jgi:hypothetical protein
VCQFAANELIIKHLGREMVLDPRPAEPSEIGFAAFYADCVHEVRPITAGCRLALARSPQEKEDLRWADLLALKIVADAHSYSFNEAASLIADAGKPSSGALCQRA